MPAYRTSAFRGIKKPYPENDETTQTYHIRPAGRHIVCTHRSDDYRKRVWLTIRLTPYLPIARICSPLVSPCPLRGDLPPSPSSGVATRLLSATHRPPHHSVRSFRHLPDRPARLPAPALGRQTHLGISRQRGAGRTVAIRCRP